MRSNFDPAEYWEKRLSNQANLRATGHRAFSDKYNQWIYLSQRDCLEYLIQKYGIKFDGKKILDIGSGYGYYIDYFLGKSPEKISGVDITNTSVNFLREKFPGLSFYKLDISESISVFDHKFDFISAISVLIHIIDDEKFHSTITNMCKLLSPNGYLLFTDSFRKPFLPQVRHVKMRDISEYEPIFSEFNIKVLDIYPVHYFIDKLSAPFLPRVLDFFQLYRWLYRIDNKLRERGVENGRGMKMLLAQVRQ